MTKKAILKSKTLINDTLSNCILTVSVGQLNHEGDKFFATALAVNKQFGSCLIMVCDSLQRHTMKIASEAHLNELHQESNKLGQEWIARNALAMEQLQIPHEISRWDTWLHHKSYPEKRSFINSLYQNDPHFKKCIDDTANRFSERKMDVSVVDKSTAFHLSQEYLLEECAVMLIQADAGYQFEIYPSQRNDAMDYVYRQVISYTNNELMQAVSIKFKNLSPHF